MNFNGQWTVQSNDTSNCFFGWFSKHPFMKKVLPVNATLQIKQKTETSPLEISVLTQSSPNWNVDPATIHQEKICGTIGDDPEHPGYKFELCWRETHRSKPFALYGIISPIIDFGGDLGDPGTWEAEDDTEDEIGR
jgi:hypothetical protein